MSTVFQNNPAAAAQRSLLPPQMTTNNSFLVATDTTEPPASVFPKLSDTQRNLSCTAPVFFVGKQAETHITSEPETRDGRSLSIGYGERRLSRILAENENDAKSKRDETKLPKRQVFLGVAEARRGLFGDGNVEKVSTGASTTDINPSLHLAESKSKTIRVFGYPSNLVNNIVIHFNQYGKIENYETSAGNWISITYEKNSSALAAMKSNGCVISKNHLVGVILVDEEPTSESIKLGITPLTDGVFKRLDIKRPDTNGVGSGKAGVSAIDSVNRGADSVECGLWVKLKEVLFTW